MKRRFVQLGEAGGVSEMATERDGPASLLSAAPDPFAGFNRSSESLRQTEKSMLQLKLCCNEKVLIGGGRSEEQMNFSW